MNEKELICKLLDLTCEIMEIEKKIREYEEEKHMFAPLEFLTDNISKKHKMYEICKEFLLDEEANSR